MITYWWIIVDTGGDFGSSFFVKSFGDFLGYRDSGTSKVCNGAQILLLLKWVYTTKLSLLSYNVDSLNAFISTFVNRAENINF